MYINIIVYNDSITYICVYLFLAYALVFDFKLFPARNDIFSRAQTYWRIFLAYKSAE